MNDENVHHVDHNEREDLLHTDTIAGGGRDAIDPAGYEQSLNPVGEVPTTGEGGMPIDDAGSISDRVGRDPSGLGDDIPDAGDVVHPAPVNAPIGKMPGM